MNSEFQYLLDKINNAKIVKYPFEHIYIENFFNKKHLDIILKNKDIHFDECENLNELLEKLNKNYKIVSNPGCVTNIYNYIKQINNYVGNTNKTINSSGIAFQYNERDENIKNIMEFIRNKNFKESLLNVFNIKNIDYDSNSPGRLTKQLSGYQISPHPDVKETLVSILININKDDSINKYDVHTKLHILKDEFKYIYDYWNNHPEINRNWLPWEYTTPVFNNNKNNTLIAWSPNSHTLHSIKCFYNHLKFQRTVIYSDIINKNVNCYLPPTEDFLKNLKKYKEEMKKE